MAIHNMVGYGGSFYYLLVLGYATEKETNKDKVPDDKNNNLKSSNMTDKKNLKAT